MMVKPSGSGYSYHFLVLFGTLADGKTTRVHQSHDPEFSPPPLSRPTYIILGSFR